MSERNLPLIVLGYMPNKTSAYIFAALYIVVGGILAVQLWRYKTWWGLCLPIGAITTGAGYAFRVVVVNNPSSIGYYAIMSFLVSCMPALFFAWQYILYGRLLKHSLGARHSIISPNIVSVVFICSDAFTFLIQSSGAGLQVSEGTQNLGRILFKVGIIAQAGSFLVFLLFLLYTHIHVNREGANKHAAWRKVLWTLYISSFFIVIRCIFRIGEGIASKGSPINKNEVYLYVLDSAPLLIAAGIFIPYWPAKYLAQDSIVHREEYKLTGQGNV
ncbi:RTA1 like protein-domain-containing protein [Mycena floridula]|nr:RTA1 like protein-domain-containing protein [Mycena floridula]